ncbi:MAG TPA: retropepsin-like aspartic protease, partial [Steroidobacteraceae bacterium]
MTIEPVVLDDIAVTADEPRFVAPTRRDRIGRIWAPVSINGQGPFRLVLDTGASHSALTARVAEALGIPVDPSHSVMLRGATGSVAVPVIPVRTLEVGDLL